MLQLLQTRNFRMLRSNSVALQPFHVLVGQNATGKSTLLGALRILSDILQGGVESAVESVAPSFYDLCFDRSRPIAFAVELAIPGNGEDPRQARYEIEVGIDESGLRVLRENLFLKPAAHEPGLARPGLSRPGLRASLFDADEIALPVISQKPPKSWRKVVSKTQEGRDYFRDEKTNWNNVFRFGLDKAALGSLPEDPDRFPLSIAVRNALRDGIRTLALDIRKMRLAAPPGGPPKMKPDGSNSLMSSGLSRSGILSSSQSGYGRSPWPSRGSKGSPCVNVRRTRSSSWKPRSGVSTERLFPRGCCRTEPCGSSP